MFLVRGVGYTDIAVIDISDDRCVGCVTKNTKLRRPSPPLFLSVRVPVYRDEAISVGTMNGLDDVGGYKTYTYGG